MTSNQTRLPGTSGRWATLNGAHHRTALNLFLLVVLAHWAEHLVQAYQIWGLGWSRPEARGVLGMPFPWLVSSEWLHYGYAIVMLVGMWMLRPGFVGRSRSWWTLAVAIQFWHHIEHLLLLLQAQTGRHLFDSPVPTSLLQVVIPRVELHLFYNTVVFVPMVIAMYLHLRPSAAEAERMWCSCRQPEAAAQLS
ncbi:hypothetical protein ACGFIR_29100 [Micromonospora sp. NPDC049051]|uniref:hypothetical protein n=1 Tax=unclassified Micromonospora TaxID=2617518 RepID=UPI0037169D30